MCTQNYFDRKLVGGAINQKGINYQIYVCIKYIFDFLDDANFTAISVEQYDDFAIVKENEMIFCQVKSVCYGMKDVRKFLNGDYDSRIKQKILICSAYNNEVHSLIEKRRWLEHRIKNSWLHDEERILEDYKKEIETKAQEQRDAQAKATADYWANVNKIVESRQIGKYRIPESFTREVDGKKIVITPKDFYEYLSVPKETENGRVGTGYQNDLAALSDEEYMNREILDAWLMFTGGTYENLIDMAVREEEVRRLRVKSKERRSTKTVKVVKNPAGKPSIDDIVL